MSIYCLNNFLLNETGLDRHSGILILAIEKKNEICARIFFRSREARGDFDEITGNKYAIDNCYDLSGITISVVAFVFVGRAQKLQILLFRFVIKLQASTGNYPGQVQLLLSEIVAEKIGKLKK